MTPISPSPRPVRLVAALLVCAFVAQAVVASHRDSVTIDEYAHLPVGLYILYTGDFSVDPINPPLARMLAALPLLTRPPAFRADPRAGAWGLGYELMVQNAERYQSMYEHARLVIIAMAVALGLLVFVWARRMYGWPEALAALFLWTFSPGLLAHGHLVTLDMAGALGFAAALYAVWRFLERPSWTWTVVLAAVIGVATLLKLSGFVLIAAVLLLIGVRAVGERSVEEPAGPTIMGWLARIVVIGLVAMLVLNAGYGFQGTFASLDTATFDPHGRLAALREALPWLRLPLPIPFLDGVDMVLNVGKGHEPSYFLAGRLSSEGWWYYHLAAFALKTPLPLLLVSVAATVAWILGRGRGRRGYCLFLPVIVIFAANSLFNSLDIGVRHVLPVLPLLCIASAPLLAGGFRRWAAGSRDVRTRVQCVAAAVLVLWYTAGTLAVAPRYLQYFNEVAGGPSRGHEMLIDSNIDWGQDLIRLREFMTRRGYDSVHLAYFGRVHPGVYGIRFLPLEGHDVHGPVVVSASFLMGRPYFWYQGGRMRWVHANTYTWLQSYKPIARVGSMFAYELP